MKKFAAAVACIAALGTLTVATAPVPAAAQACTNKPQGQHCVSKFPPSGYMDLRGASGGIVACPSGSKVQFDYYTTGNNNSYQCTRILNCSQIQGSPPHQRFC